MLKTIAIGFTVLMVLGLAFEVWYRRVTRKMIMENRQELLKEDS